MDLPGIQTVRLFISLYLWYPSNENNLREAVDMNRLQKEPVAKGPVY